MPYIVFDHFLMAKGIHTKIPAHIDSDDKYIICSVKVKK